MVVSVGGGYLAAGTATKDAQFKLVGEKQTPVCECSIAAGKRKDTTTIFVNFKCWRGLAEYAAQIRKGDAVCIIGPLEEREYNGKTYSTVVCDWLSVAKPGAAAAVPAASAPKTFAPSPGSAFTDLADAEDGELPF